MYRSQEVVHSGEAGEGVSFVINGIVKVACIDMKDTQDYFLGSGESTIGSDSVKLHNTFGAVFLGYELFCSINAKAVPERARHKSLLICFNE